MSRFSSSLLIPLISLALLAGAIFTGGRHATDAKGRATVVYAHPPCPPDLMRDFDKAFAAFRKSHPNINLKVLHITSDYDNKVKIMFAGKIAPDVIFMYPPDMPAWVSLHALKPLNQLFKENGKTKPSDYFPAGLRTFSYHGKIYGLPKDASASILFYNRDMFKRDGVAPPSPDWTWQDMLHAAKRLTRDTNGDGRTNIYGMEQPDWQLLVRQNGGRIISKDGRRCVLDSPQAIQALKFWVALRQKYKVVPTPETMSDMTPWRLFALKRCGMFISMYPAVPMLRATCNFDWDIALVPRGPKRAYAIYKGSALAVTSQCRNPAAAFEWARWMTTTGMRYVMSFDIPAYRKLGSSKAWRDKSKPPPSKQVAVDTMAIAGPPMRNPHSAQILDTITPLLDRANRGACTVKQAVAQIVPKVNAILARSARQDSTK